MAKLSPTAFRHYAPLALCSPDFATHVTAERRPLSAREQLAER